MDERNAIRVRPGACAPTATHRVWLRSLTGLLSFLLLLGACLAAAVAVGAQPAPDFQIVVHDDNPTTELSTRDLSRIFLRKMTSWPDGRKIQPVDQSVGSAVREAFSEAVHRRSGTAVRNYWQTMIFSGRALPPPELGSDREVLDYVKSRPNAIGYVSARASLPSGAHAVSVVR